MKAEEKMSKDYIIAFLLGCVFEQLFGNLVLLFVKYIFG